MDRVIYAEDLTASGEIIMLLFSLKYPQGLTLGEMLESEEGWVQRAARRLMEVEDVQS